MTPTAAVLLAGILIAAAILFGGRYDFRTIGDDIIRLDRLTGRITHCASRPSGLLSNALTFQCTDE
ncbi:MAG: hypothetical protein AAF871_08435 [Pseudomonadota bacterium]